MKRQQKVTQQIKCNTIVEVFGEHFTTKKLLS